MKRANTTTTHYQHIDRVHSKRIVELATGTVENIIDVAQMTFSECVVEERILVAAMSMAEDHLIAAKRDRRVHDVGLIGNRISFLNRRKGACKLRRKELHAKGIGEGKRFLKAAMRDILPENQCMAIFERANELEAAALQQMVERVRA